MTDQEREALLQQSLYTEGIDRKRIGLGFGGDVAESLFGYLGGILSYDILLGSLLFDFDLVLCNSFSPSSMLLSPFSPLPQSLELLSVQLPPQLFLRHSVLNWTRTHTNFHPVVTSIFWIQLLA